MLETLHVRSFHSINTLEMLAPKWNELLSEFESATIFCTWEWLSSWWHAFSDGQTLLVLGFFDDSEHLVAIAPLMLDDRPVRIGRLRILRLLGDGSGDSDNLDVPVRRGYQQAVMTCLCDWLRQQADEWDLCEFNTMPPDSAAVRLAARARDLEWAVFQSEHPRSIVHLPETWEAYFHLLPNEDQYNLPRYLRRLKRRYCVQFRKCKMEAELPAALEALFRLHQMRWQARGEPGTFNSGARRNFYQALSRALLAKGLLDLWLLELDGRPAAAQFAIRYRNTAFQLQEGFDPSHRADRVGYLLRGHILQQLIADGVRHYDFLGGRASHKLRWLAQDDTYVTVRFAKPHSLGAMYAAWVHHSDISKEWLRTCLPLGAWKTLHQINLRLNKPDGPCDRFSPDSAARSESYL
jgi:CelD/BcsL family acetyltransferase involved in cellulose biosynthesis